MTPTTKTVNNENPHLFAYSQRLKHIQTDGLILVWIGILCGRIEIIGFGDRTFGALDMSENEHGIIEKH